jgi:hypothetical protein
LLALVFSYVIPFVKINLPAVSQQKKELIFDEIQTQQLIQTTTQATDFNWMNLIVSICILISIGLIIRTVISIRKIITLKGQEINYQNQKVKLVEKNLPPFSFWNKIYLNKNYLKKGKSITEFFNTRKHILFRNILGIFCFYNF